MPVLLLFIFAFLAYATWKVLILSIKLVWNLSCLIVMIVVSAVVWVWTLARPRETQP
jgi:hypothetical protein